MRTRFKEMIRRSERSDGVIDPIKSADKYLEDPMSINDFNVTDKGIFASFNGTFKSLKMKGLKNLKIDSMKFDLEWMHLNVVMSIPRLRLDGEYNLSGKLAFVPLRGFGDFWMKIRGLKFLSTASLNRTSNGKFQVSAIVLDLEADKIDMNFENLVGGNLGSSITNSVLNQLNHLLFDQMKYSLIDELRSGIQSRINYQLETLPDNFIHESSSSLLDHLLDKVKSEIAKSGYDPYDLPDLMESFQQDLRIFNLHGDASLYNGTLYGLSTLVRTGHVIAHYEKDSVILEANLGFENLTANYDWKVNLMDAGPAGSAEINVNSVDGYLKLRQPLKRGSKPILEEFKVKKIRNVWVDVTGLGTMDFLVEMVVNLISNVFKRSIADVISGPIQKILQKELDKVPLDYFIN